MNKQLVEKLNHIWNQAKCDSPLQQKSAVCVSSINAEGFPNARFVDLKSISESGFTFCTAYESEKGKNLNSNPKVALSAWWDHIGSQIRVLGIANPITDELADKYWATRSHEAHVASTCFNQSDPWQSATPINVHFNTALASNSNAIKRPKTWGGYTIQANSIEILSFKENRVHVREYFVKAGEDWEYRLLQP